MGRRALTRVYLDSDVLIEHLRGNPVAMSLILGLVNDPDADPVVLAVQRVEVVFHLKPGELPMGAALFALLETEPLTARTVEEGAVLYRRWKPSHGTDPNDALLAAAAIASGGTLYTRNARHFPMPGLTVIRPF